MTTTTDLQQPQQVFMVGEHVFKTKKEAQDFQRRPKILEALKPHVGDNEDLANWIVENQEGVREAFDVGTIKRVSKSERNKLSKALENLAELGDPKFAFLVDNSEAIVDSFRWPSVKRMDDEEKATAALEAITALANGNGQLAQFVVTNRENILEAFDAGKVKRKPNPAAMAALAAHREKVAAEKAAREEAEAAEASEG